MAQKIDTNVVIGGKVYTLSGSESEEYMQKVASYLNNKYQECERADSYKLLSRDLQQIMLQINMVDDYFKSQRQIKLLEDQVTEKNNDLDDLKHKYIAAQMKLEESLKRLKSLEDAVGRLKKN